VGDGLGILLALAAVFAPLALAWVLVARAVRPRRPSHSKTKPTP
jgi:hypothetical protein